MKLKEILSPSYKDLARNPNLIHPSATVRACLSDWSDFCKETVAKGWLTEKQMIHAAERYYLGKSQSGKPIFWMINHQGQTLDGHIGDSWVSLMLRERDPATYGYRRTSHCLFGEHLQNLTSGIIAIVENEASAVILSELYPQMTWMAFAYPTNYSSWKLEPLKGRQVMLFPRASVDMENYMLYFNIAEAAKQDFHLDITVNDVLEKHATPVQKAREIDLVDFIFYDYESNE